MGGNSTEEDEEVKGHTKGGYDELGHDMSQIGTIVVDEAKKKGSSNGVKQGSQGVQLKFDAGDSEEGKGKLYNQSSETRALLDIE